MTIAAVASVQDFAIVMLVALGMALVSYAIRQPLIIGYILAGIIIGPYTPPFGLLIQPDVLNFLAEIGIVFLLFAIGLEYPISRLRSVGRKATIIAIVQSLATFGIGFLVGEALGFGVFDSLFLALAISVTSTVILSRLLEDLGVLNSEEASLILGVTIIEDVVVVSVLGVLQGVASSGALSVSAIPFAIILVVAFVGGVLTIGARTIPPLIDRLASIGHRDLFLVGILALAFGLAIVSSLIGISVAIGAFLAGVMVAESKSQGRAHDLITPLKALFGAIFFVSMGALMDVAVLPMYIFPIAALLATGLAVKFLSTYLTARRLGESKRSAQLTASNVAAFGGEVSLTVAKGGEDVGAGAFVLPIIGALTIITTFLTPYLVRWAWHARDPQEAPPGEPETGWATP